MAESVSGRRSFFRELNTRQVNGFRVRKRPHFGDLSSECGVLMVEHYGETTPPLAVSFCKTSSKSHILAVSDEEGYVSLYNTRRRMPSLATCRENTMECKVSEWIAHENAIFDVCWTRDDTHILTASGDQKISVWNVEKNACVGTMNGHSGSVKTLCSHQSNGDIFVSGSRDGSIAIWDLRCKSTLKSSHEMVFSSIAVVKDAHTSPHKKRINRGKAASKSITSVLCLKDGVSIASAGAVDSTIKLWDTRYLKSSIGQMSPCPEPFQQHEKSLHGLSSLSQDSSGTLIAASCMDNMVYLYNVLHHHKGHVNTFSGSRIGSFYIKAAISPDGSHIMSGSSNGNAFIWQVNNPEANPVELKGHQGEVTAVDWSSSETGKVATSSDDFMVRIWNTNGQNSINMKSPTPIRKRVRCLSSMECRKLFDYETPASPQTPTQEKDAKHSSKEEYEEKANVSFRNEDLELQKSPSGRLNSPDSVLNIPPSLKRRTIRDYFSTTAS